MRTLPILFIFSFLINCASNMLLFVDKNTLPSDTKINKNPIIKDTVELIVVRKGALCMDNPIECKSTVTGYYPESLFGKYGEGTSSSPYGSKTYSSLMKFLPKMVSKYQLRSFQSVYDWQNFQNEFKPNILLITVKEEESLHWSMFVSVLTIGIVPGYNSIQPKTEIVLYDKNGVGRTIEHTAVSGGHVWHHLTFFGWAYVYSHIISPKMYDAYFEEVFSTAVPIK